MKIVHWKEIQMQNFLKKMIIQTISLRSLYSLVDFLAQEGVKKVKNKVLNQRNLGILNNLMNSLNHIKVLSLSLQKDARLQVAQAKQEAAKLKL